METLGLIGLVVGCGWGGAGVLGYPGVRWQPGAVLAVVCAVWLIFRGTVSPEGAEGWAVAIFLVLLFARQWFFPTRQEKQPPPPGAG